MTAAPDVATRPLPGAGLWAAIGFLTILPIPARARDAALLRNAPRWFPVVGAVLALPLVAVALLPLPPLPRAALVLTLWVVLTGGLHEDGWIDTMDGALAPASRARRLEILKDPLVGAHGVTGGILLLLGRLVLLASVPPVAVLVAPVLGRWGMATSVATAPPPSAGPPAPAGLASAVGTRSGSVRTDVVGGASASALLFLALTGALLVGAGPGAAGAGGWSVSLQLLTPPGGGGPLDRVPLRILLAGLAVPLTTLAVVRFLTRRFGRVTGDGHGAVGLVAEVVALAAFVPLAWGPE